MYNLVTFLPREWKKLTVKESKNVNNTQMELLRARELNLEHVSREPFLKVLALFNSRTRQPHVLSGLGHVSVLLYPKELFYRPH